MLELKGVRSGSYPELVDSTSSPTTVYVRSNIDSEEVKNFDQTYIQYVYDEVQYTREEWIIKENEALKNEVSSMKTMMEDMVKMISGLKPEAKPETEVPK